MSKSDRSDHEQRPPETRRAADEAVHVPKGQSRWRFMLILGLMVVTLIIFVVPDQLQALVSPRQGGGSYVSWQRPGHAARSLTAESFQTQRQQVVNLLGMTQNRTEVADDENFARLLIVDELARECGVDVSDAEVVKATREGELLRIGDQFVFVRGFQDTKTFQEACRAFQVVPSQYQATLRMLMRVHRFEHLLGYALAQPDPTLIEEEWKKAHQLHSYDVAVADVASALVEAEAALPAEPELRAWFDALPNKASLFAKEWRQERVSAELCGWMFGSPEPAGLLAKFPRPEGTDLEQLSKDYYNLYANVRFRRPEEKPDAADDRDRLFLPIEEVAAQARSESAIHAALVDWQKSVKDRVAAGETVDLATEAPALGLFHRLESAPKTVQEWNALEGLGGPLMTRNVFKAARGDKMLEVYVGERELVGGRVLEHLPPGPPPFEEVSQTVAAEWKQQKAIETTRARADAARAALAAQPPSTDGTQALETPGQVTADAASFEAAATAQGMTVLRTGWFDPSEVPEQLPETPTETDRFLAELRVAPEFSAAVEGEIVGPRADTERQRVWLVRGGGTKDPETVALEPKDLEVLRANLEQAAAMKYRSEVIGARAFEKTFGLKFEDGRVIGGPETTPEG